MSTRRVSQSKIHFCFSLEDGTHKWSVSADARGAQVVRLIRLPSLVVEACLPCREMLESDVLELPRIRDWGRAYTANWLARCSLRGSPPCLSLIPSVYFACIGCKRTSTFPSPENHRWQEWCTVRDLLVVLWICVDKVRSISR